MANRAIGLLQQAAERGERTAIRFEDRCISFAELADRVCATAGGLRHLGIARGTRVGIMLPSQPEFVIVQQALFLLGAIVSPINPAFRAAEVAQAIRTCELQCVVLAMDLQLRLSNCDGAILIDAPSDTPGFRSLPQACRAAAPITAPVAVAADDVVMLLCTSATTGKAKGVMLTAGNLAANYDRTPGWLGLTADDVILCALPLFNTFGLNQCINVMTATGAELVLLCGFDAGQCIQTIARRRCTFLPAVPTMLHKILDQLPPGSGALQSIRLVMTGGAPVPAALLARLKQVVDPSARVVTGYGLTEATALVTLADVALGADGELVQGRTIGRVLDGMWLGVADRTGRLLAPGETGELVIRGPNLMAGYYRAPGATAAALVDGTLHTGDVGYVDAQGYAYIVDRQKDIIIRGGQNIYPADIEDVLYGMAGVAEAAVVGAQDAIFGEIPIAYIAISAGHDVTAAAMLARCREELAPYKWPAAVHVLAELPKGPTGKILRRALRPEILETPPA